MTAAATSVPRSRLVLHTAGIALTSFLMSANGSVLPQVFYQRFYPDRKVLLLAGCLFAGTSAAIAGVVASRAGAPRRVVVLAALLATLAAENALFLVRGAFTYLAMNAAAQLGANYVTNALDHVGAARAGEMRRLHDLATNLVRLLGMLAAPAFFTAFYDRRTVLHGALAAGGIVAFAGTVSLLTRPAVEVEADGGAGPRGARPLDRADRLFFGYAVAVYVALYLLAANVIYLLRDVAGLDDAERRGGTTLVVVFSFALVANAAFGLRRRASGPRRPSVASLVAPSAVLAAVAAALASGAARAFPVILAGAAVLGLAYGFFLAEVREYASSGAHEQQKTGLLTLFNNMANLSSLLAFGSMIALAASARGAGTYGRVLAMIGALPVASLPLLFLSTASFRRRLGPA